MEFTLKKKLLERTLNKLGWWKVHGAKDDKWTNGIDAVAVPRHSEINEFTAIGITHEVKRYNKLRGLDEI